MEKSFTVEYKGKIYYVSYLDSDDPILGLSNRDNREVIDEEGEELNCYILKDAAKKEKRQVMKNAKLYCKLIFFCIRQFNDYKPEL